MHRHRPRPDLVLGADTAGVEAGRNWIRSRTEHPLELEIGSSFGEVLCGLAEANPERRYLGVDIDFYRCAIAAGRARLLGADNLRIIHGYGEEFLDHFAENDFLDGLHIYFPSPYGQQGRPFERLFGESFANKAFRSLRLGGILRLLTDDREYHRDICEVAQQLGFWSAAWLPLPYDVPDGYLVNSPWEKKCRPINEIFPLCLIK